MSDKKASGKFDISLMQEDVKKHEQGSPCYMPIEEDVDPRYQYTKEHSKVDFSPTKIKNYPVQGFATGDIVPECTGRMFRAIIAEEHLRNLLLMINTVHDSNLFDCHLSI